LNNGEVVHENCEMVLLDSLQHNKATAGGIILKYILKIKL
jgi:hypothetical protein